MSMLFHSWQAHPFDSMGKAPYNLFSPNLALVASELRRRFSAKGGSGFNVRGTRDDDPNDDPMPSSHGFGAARGLDDLTIAPVGPEVWPDPTIRLGVPRSEKVAQLQRKLTQLGINVGRDDGVCGPRTDTGIRELQKRLGMTVDGWYGPMTAKAARAKWPV